MGKKTGDKPAPRFRVSDLNALLDLALPQMEPEDMAAAAVAITAIGDRYSARNRLIMWIQRPEVRHVAGIHEWRRRGRKVRKGEKGIAFLAPVKKAALRNTTTVSETEHVEQDTAAGTAGESTGAGPRQVTGVCVRYVFDISQTEPAQACEDCGSQPGHECNPTCPATLGETAPPGQTSGATVTADDVAELVTELQEQAEQAAARRADAPRSAAGDDPAADGVVTLTA